MVGATVVGMLGLAAYLNRKDRHAQVERYMATGVCPVCGLETGVTSDGYCEFCQELVDFFKANPNPSDKDMHTLAGKLNMKPDDLEEKVYSMLSYHLRENNYSSGDSATTDFQKAILEHWRFFGFEPMDREWEEWSKEFNMDADEMGAVYTDLIRQIDRGVEVEREHKPTIEKDHHFIHDDDVYRSIAIDHLLEFPDYYTRLDNMEEQAKKDWGSQSSEETMFAALFGNDDKALGDVEQDGGKAKVLEKEAEKEGGKLKKIIKMAKQAPVPDGWNDYYNKKIGPKMKKILKVITGGAKYALLLSPFTALLGVGLIILSWRAKKLKKTTMSAKGINFFVAACREVVGRFVGLTALFLGNDKDVKKTVADVKSLTTAAYGSENVPVGVGKEAEVKLPRVNIDWTKISEGKLITSAILIANDLVGLFGGAAVGGTAGGVVGGVAGVGAGAPPGAAAGGGAGASIGTVLMVADDVIALGLIVSALKNAVTIERG